MLRRPDTFLFSTSHPLVNIRGLHNADLMSAAAAAGTTGAGSPPDHGSMAIHHQDYYSVIDVYDSAADIGKEFERIIDLYGSDCIATVMPKIVSVLEQLEYLAQKNERENAELLDMKMTVKKLETDKVEKLDQKVKYEKEIEAIEEQWKKEADDLMDTVQKLTDENRRLAAIVNDSGDLVSAGGGGRRDRAASGSGEDELVIMGKLKDVVDKQREQIKCKDKDIQRKQADCEAFQLQLDRITKVNQELRRKTKVLQQQSKAMIEDKVDLQSKLQERDHHIREINEQLGTLQKQSEDLNTANEENETEKEKKDPDKPRFTLNELREVLQERNDLKARLIEVEEELEFYRPKSKGSQSPSEGGESSTQVDEEDPHDLPVQGPLPYEPEDAPWRRAELGNNATNRTSGIKKFFQFFFGDSRGPSGRSSPAVTGLTATRSSSMTTFTSPKHSPKHKTNT